MRGPHCLARRVMPVAILLAAVPPVLGQTAAPIQPAALRERLYAIAADSMGGRDTGSRGDYLTAEYVANAFRAAGLQPAGEGGTFFQTIPFVHVHPDPAGTLSAGGRTLAIGRDWLPLGGSRDWDLEGMETVYGGVVGDSTTWPAADRLAGRLVVLRVPPGELRTLGRVLGPTIQNPRMAGVGGLALILLDRIPVDLREQILQGTFTTDTTTRTPTRFGLMVSSAAAAVLLGGEPASLAPGTAGVTVQGTVAIRRDPLAWAARNVIAVLPGSDPARRGTYVSISAHNDHVGFTATAVDHDSVYAHNRVIRPMGADSPDHSPTPAETARIRTLLDSLRALRPDRPDSVFNGADDDGSGTVALVEVARALAAGPHPRRSVLFVSHAAEERGLLGSGWFTDHPTVPRDSIIAEMDMDMIGRGDATDLPKGGPGYLEVIGSRRLSHEYGDLFDKVNGQQPQPFQFNYEYDAPGHPLQYYCRADHYSYARYGIPAVAISRGEHADYHQVTDEPEYIDYDALARVANLVLDFARTVANQDHRPLVDGPVGDPHAPCRQ